jgi:hypothetical protein
MTYRGHVKNGVVLLDEPADLPDGSAVEVMPVAPAGSASDAGQWLLQFAGIVKDLPPDFAENHDHYIHGTPKK